jgi:DNA polymerase-1
MTEGVEVLQSRRKKTTKARGVEYVEKHGPPSIGSPTQVSRLLFDGDLNADKEALQRLALAGGDQGILADLILGWRKAAKALTTYFYPLQGKDKLTGLFNITPDEDMEGGTGTGRLSSERANLQNQPPAVQRCLRAPEGFLLRRGDYPQIELRCAAEISDDPTMLEALSDPERDLHQETADRLFNGDRARGKVFNFRELYIAGAAVKEAYPRFYEWAQEHWAAVQRTSYSVSPEPFLHRRFIPLLAGDHARKAAINHPVQSMAVYITKVAMNELFQEGSLLVNQVHDSVHDFVPADGDRDLQAQSMAGIMEDVMQRYLPRVGNVPVDVKISKYWSDE